MCTGKVWTWVECNCKATERYAHGYFAGKKGMKHIMNGIKENTSEVQKQERPSIVVVCSDLGEGRIKPRGI